MLHSTNSFHIFFGLSFFDLSTSKCSRLCWPLFFVHSLHIRQPSQPLFSHKFFLSLHTSHFTNLLYSRSNSNCSPKIQKNMHRWFIICFLLFKLKFFRCSSPYYGYKSTTIIRMKQYFNTYYHVVWETRAVSPFCRHDVTF